MVVLGALRAAGQTTTSMFLATTHAFLIFAIAFVLVRIFDLRELGVWWAYPVANSAAMGFGVLVLPATRVGAGLREFSRLK